MLAVIDCIPEAESNDFNVGVHFKQLHLPGCASHYFL